MKIKNNIITVLIILTILILIPVSFACGPDGEEATLKDNTIIFENNTGYVELTNNKYTINDGEINIQIENKTIATGNIINNSAELKNTDETLELGEYTGLLRYTGSKSFIDFEQTVTVILEEAKIPTTITDTKLRCNDGHTTVHIEAEDGSTINEGIIRIYVGDTCMANGQVINNSAYISPSENVTQLCPPGVYDGIVIYEGTKNYKETEKELKITVPDHDALVEVEILENTINTITNNITIHLQAENDAIIDCGILTLELNGKTLTSTVENSNGIFTDLNLKEGLNSGTIKYNCNNQHYTNITKEITINKGDGIIKIQTHNITTKYNSQDTINGILLDEYNNPIGKITINITIELNDKSKTYQVETNEKGEYNLNINLAPETYTIKTQYENITSENTLTIEKVEGTTKTNDYAGTYGVSGNFTGTLTIDNNPVKGETIALNLTRLTNGLWKVYYVTTNDNGEYKLPINLAPGKYTAETILPKNKYLGENTVNSIIIS